METNASCPILITVLVKDSCTGPPEHRRGGCPLASLSRTSVFSDLGALSESQPHGTTTRESQSPTLRPRLGLQCLQLATQTSRPRMVPSQGLTPHPGPPSRCSPIRTWSGGWTRSLALRAPRARQLPFDKQRQLSTWPRPRKAPPPDRPVLSHAQQVRSSPAQKLS